MRDEEPPKLTPVRVGPNLRAEGGLVKVDGGWADGKIVGTVLDPADAARLQGQAGLVPNFDPAFPKKGTK